MLKLLVILFIIRQPNEVGVGLRTGGLEKSDCKTDDMEK